MAENSGPMLRKRDDAPLTLCLKDANLKLARFDWKRGNDLIVCGSAAGDTLKPSAARGQKTAGLLHEILWDASLYNSQARKLISESNSFFIGLRKSGKESDPANRKLQFIKISRQYRSVIKEFVDNLQLGADATEDETQKSNLEVQGQIFYKVELIWNLCEILFIDVKPAGPLLLQLLDWVRWHFSECEVLAMKVMKSENPSSHPSYWDAVYGYVLQGRIDEVRKLLRANHSSRTDGFVIMDDLLRKMPIYSSYMASSMPDFDLRWHQWQDECQIRLERGDFNASPNLEVVCGILCGKLETFQEIMHLCETWYHLMVSHLFYSNPCVKADDLQRVAHIYIEMCGGLSNMGELDAILLLALEFNVLEVIKHSSQHLDSWWFVAHLMDLLYRVDVGLGGAEGEVSLREFLLLEYASSLASHDSLWQFAIDYYDDCPVHGPAMLEVCLERVPLTSEWKAMLVVELAMQRNLIDCARSVCKVMGQRAIHNGRLDSALSWMLKSKDAAFTSHLAEKFLANYNANGHFHSLSLLDNLGPSMLVSDQLTFLGKYREFHRLYESKEFQQAGNILVCLLTSKLAPKTFWQTILLDSIPLLEADEMVFDSEQTLELTYCLAELVSSRPKEAVELDNTKEQLIRLALNRNLMRAYTTDGVTD